MSTEQSTTTADRWVDRIEARCRQLADFPEMGAARPDIDPAAPHLVIERWLTLYEIVPGGVFVVRVIDAMRDLSEIDFSGE